MLLTTAVAQIPGDLKPYYHWLNIPASSDPESSDNPWNFIRAIAKPTDHVFVKVGTVALAVSSEPRCLWSTSEVQTFIGSFELGERHRATLTRTRHFDNCAGVVSQVPKHRRSRKNLQVCRPQDVECPASHASLYDVRVLLCMHFGNMSTAGCEKQASCVSNAILLVQAGATAPSACN